MTVTTDALVPALEDTKETQSAVIDRFRADLTVTPVGPHRQTLERHVADAPDQLSRIDDHVREIRPRRILRDTTEMVRNVSGSAVRTAMIPLEIGALIAGGLLRGGRQATERQLLKNVEDEYAVTARALAACRAGESIATLAHDDEAADLLAELRRQDERLLETLEHSVDERARALATATADGGRSQYDGGITGAATRAVRTAVDRIREAAQTGGQQAGRTVAGTVREMPSATRMAEQVQGAVTREEDLPVPDYGQLSVSDLTERLRTLSQSDLTVVEGYERAHANRTRVLNAIGELRGGQPWPGYDSTGPDEIATRVRSGDPGRARRVLEYEQRHRQRRAVVDAAKERVGGD